MSVDEIPGEDRVWAYLAVAAERGELKPVPKALGKAELDAIRARVRAEHGDDLGEFLRAVFDHDDHRVPPEARANVTRAERFSRIGPEARTGDEWIYERSADGSARFVLGTVGDNPLVCFGINPSTAQPGALDPTVKRVARFANDNGFDSWTMLNVYPQIATDPKLIDREFRPELKLENESQIARAIDGRPLTLLAAWGGLIASRPYLPSLLGGIVDLATEAGCNWVSLGEPTKGGHPRHPLYVRADAQLLPFDAVRYIDA